MKTMNITKLPERVEKNADWMTCIKQLPRQPIDCLNWQEYPYRPAVDFAAGWNESGFFLDYNVAEQHLRAVNLGYNSAVWEDSCVEFFFQFEPGDRHYSFEFNPIGAFLGQVNHVTHADWIEPKQLKKIRVAGKHVNGGNAPLEINQSVTWDLSVFIPFELLTAKEQQRIASGAEIQVNFFKCGDKCREPHFLSWNPIEWPQPSFHRPQYFGKATLG